MKVKIVQVQKLETDLRQSMEQYGQPQDEENKEPEQFEIPKEKLNELMKKHQEDKHCLNPVDPENDEFKCGFCQKVTDDLQSAQACGHYFCGNCVENHGS